MGVWGEQNLTLLPRLEYSGGIMAHCSLKLLGSSNPTTQVAGTTGVPHHTWLIFVFLIETRFCHLAQAGFELLSLSNPPTSASQSGEITGVSHHAQPCFMFSYCNSLWVKRVFLGFSPFFFSSHPYCLSCFYLHLASWDFNYKQNLIMMTWSPPKG